MYHSATLGGNCNHFPILDDVCFGLIQLSLQTLNKQKMFKALGTPINSQMGGGAHSLATPLHILSLIYVYSLSFTVCFELVINKIFMISKFKTCYCSHLLFWQQLWSFMINNRQKEKYVGVIFLKEVILYFILVSVFCYTCPALLAQYFNLFKLRR